MSALATLSITSSRKGRVVGPVKGFPLPGTALSFPSGYGGQFIRSRVHLLEVLFTPLNTNPLPSCQELRGNIVDIRINPPFGDRAFQHGDLRYSGYQV